LREKERKQRKREKERKRERENDLKRLGTRENFKVKLCNKQYKRQGKD